MQQCNDYLGGDNEEGGFRIQLSQRFGHVRAVNVGHKPDTGAAFGIRLQGFCDHQRALKNSGGSKFVKDGRVSSNTGPDVKVKLHATQLLKLKYK